LIIEDPDDKEFIMTFKNPKTNKYMPSEKISAKASAGSLKQRIKFYYRQVWGSEISVKRLDLDEDGNEISATNKTLKSYKYEITVTKLIS
jgi:hypothetical protein